MNLDVDGGVDDRDVARDSNVTLTEGEDEDGDVDVAQEHKEKVRKTKQMVIQIGRTLQ